MKIVLDTDPGVGIRGTDADDPLALMLALTDPRLELLAVTTVFGNTPPRLGARGAAAVLAAAGRSDVPVGTGLDRPLSGRLPAVLAEAYAGERGRPGRIPLPPEPTGPGAVPLLIDTVRAHPGEVTVITIGPMTNLAAALLQAPDLRDLIRNVVFMGGALGLDPTYGRGNVTPVAECNIWFDPAAADLVFSSGLDLTMVGLDVTNPAKGVVLTDEQLRGVDRDASPLAPLLLDVCATYLEAPMFALAGHGGCVLYDPLAVAVAADPGVGVLEPMTLAVETAGTLTTGQTVPVRDAPPNVRVCVDVDGEPLVAAMLATILTGVS